MKVKEFIPFFSVFFLLELSIVALFLGGQSIVAIFYSVLFALLAILFLISHISEGRVFLILLIVVYTLAFLFRLMFVESSSNFIQDDQSEQGEYLVVVESYPESTRYGLSCVCRIYYQRSNRDFCSISKKRLLLYAKQSMKNELLIWKSLRVVGKISAIEPNNHYLRSKGYCGVLRAKSISTLEKRLSIWQKLTPVGRFRECVFQYITDSFSPKVAGFLQTIFLGDKSDLLSDVKDSFQSSGMLHILAISGFHITTLAFLILFILNLLLPQSKALILTILLLTGYMLLLNFSVSSVRAYMMFVLSSGYNLTGRKSSGLYSLCVVGSLMLWQNPYYVFDYGFIFSFSATAGILIFAKPLEVLLSRMFSGCFCTLISLVAVNISALGSVMFIQLGAFGQFPLVASMFGVVVVWLFGLLFVFSILALCVGGISQFDIANYLVEATVTLFLKLVEILSKFPILHVSDSESFFKVLQGVFFVIVFYLFYSVTPYVAYRTKRFKEIQISSLNKVATRPVQLLGHGQPI